MIIPDANLLIYAYNADDPRRDRSARWWSQCLSGSEPVILCPASLFAFVRIVTNPRAFPRPMTVREASEHVLDWLRQPVVQFAEMAAPDIPQALDLLREAGTGGNLATDAQIAAISIRLGATIHTADVDYARFPGVRWWNPLSGKRGK